MSKKWSWLPFGALALAMLLPWGEGRGDDAADDAPVAAADDADDEWPRVIEATTARIVVYQPQLDAWSDGIVEAHSALAITATGADEAVFGAVWFKARIEVDRVARVAQVYDVQVPYARFPDSTPEAEAKLAELIRQVVPEWVHPISLDRLLPALEVLEKARANDDRLRNDVPRIVVETVPALLVPIDGEAKLVAIPGTKIQRVANTPVALLFEPASRTWWIDAGVSWIQASGVDGPYRASAVVPPEVAAVKTSNERRADSAAAPGGKPAAAPKIVVAHEPTELIVFDGEPQWKPVVGDELSYAANSATAVLRTASDGRVHALLSGRWFRTASLAAGPWEFVESADLPAPFREIPEDSEIGGVLAHVAGTDLANEALLDAQIPETKAIRREGTTCTVTYDGEPAFEPVAGTDLRWAVNTPSQVLLHEGRYYCCEQGVWFVGPSPTGPWTVADQVPRAFQEIPPENPCFNVKYVYVYDATPEVVYVGYTPGYLGWYSWRGGVVWGTGWSYPCWSGAYWYPRCATWGVSVAFNPWSGVWYEGLAYHCGGGWSIGIGWSTGWGWGGGWWGPCGYHHWDHHDDDDCHHPSVHGRDFDHGGGRSAPRHPPAVYDHPRNLARNAPDRVAGRPASRPPAPPSPRAAPSPRTAPPLPRPARPRNDVYADRDAGLFRRGADGNWEERSGRQWRPVKPSAAPAPRTTAPQRPHAERPQVRSAPTPRLGRDAWARDRGSVRAGGGKAGGRSGGGGGRPSGGRHR